MIEGSDLWMKIRGLGLVLCYGGLVFHPWYQYLGAPFLIQLPAMAWESNKGWIKSLGSCTHLEDPK